MPMGGLPQGQGNRMGAGGGREGGVPAPWMCQYEGHGVDGDGKDASVSTTMGEGTRGPHLLLGGVAAVAVPLPGVRQAAAAEPDGAGPGTESGEDDRPLPLDISGVQKNCWGGRGRINKMGEGSRGSQNRTVAGAEREGSAPPPPLDIAGILRGRLVGRVRCKL